MTSPDTPDPLIAGATPVELSAAQAAYQVPADALPFATTNEVADTPEWIGQERALGALELGINIAHVGYNVYVCGLVGTNREQSLATLLRSLTAHLPRPGDRVLVQNFQNRDRPHAFYMPAGSGHQFRRDMQEVIEDLKRLLPETFRKETFEEEREQLAERYGHEAENIAQGVQQHAAEKGFSLQFHPQGGILFVPLKNGQPMQPEDVQRLTEAEQEDLRRRERELSREVKTMLRQQQALGRRLAREVKAAERRVAAEVITPLLDEIAQRYPIPEIQQHLHDVREHMLDNLDAFRDTPPHPSPAPFPLPVAAADDTLVDYQVNVLVDNGSTSGAPVITEISPTYKNLFGAVERMVDISGKLVTNFTRVKAGSLLCAHGGCIIIDAVGALTEPLVWRALKRTLKSGELEIEAYDPFALFTTTALKPEAMRISTRVVLIGPTELFQLLYFYDDEFRDTFKVRADFGYESDGEQARRSFVAHVARIAHEEQLPPFTAAAVARLLEFGARLVNDRRKLPSQWEDVADVMREGAFWSRKESATAVDDAHVCTALAQRIYRLNRWEEKLQELVRDGTLLVDLDGSKVGQINGLAVVNIGGYEFGRVSRVTASVAMGTQGIINIEREAQLSGRTHDKGVLIISGYLRHQYAQGFPLSLSASLCFEQSYAGIEGDSASSTELYALISSLSGIALRQDLAVTGSVNQWGDIQPIGGVNEKIEGYFATCRRVGLTGRQGVILPVQNVDNLVLRPDVIEAIAAGRFHLYPVRTIDQGLEVLSGCKAGGINEPGTIHQRAAERLRQLAEGLRHFAATAAREHASSAPEPVPPPVVPH